jgi:hypothetical protein
MKLLRYIPVIPLLLIFSFRPSGDIKPAKLLQQMHDSIKNISTLRMNISALERDVTSYRTAQSQIKLQTNPRKLYFINPPKKIEILYYQGRLNNKALVKTNSFPFVTLTLDPYGNLMRKNQHYTIHELGMELVSRALALAMNKDKDALNNFRCPGKTSKNGYSCYMVEYEAKNFSYTDYVVQADETVSSLAAKLSVNEYLVRYKNQLLNNYDYLKKGKTIKVPLFFCKKAVVYIDEKTMLPVSAALYDENGIFENYDFSKIEVNKTIKEEEFSKDYKDYHF